MILRVTDEKRANICDELLTKLIQDERQYDDLIDPNFVVKDYFKNVIKNTNNYLFCYEDDGVVKGYIFLKESEDKKGYIIDGLYVENEYRNQKIATNLLEKSFEVATSNNASYVDISTLYNNKVAYKLYKHLGFNEFKINLRKNLK